MNFMNTAAAGCATGNPTEYPSRAMALMAFWEATFKAVHLKVYCRVLSSFWLNHGMAQVYGQLAYVHYVIKHTLYAAGHNQPNHHLASVLQFG